MKSSTVNLCVVFTEFQLLQAESIISHYGLKNNHLILGDNARIHEDFINRTLFERIEVIPPYAENGSVKKLFPAYLKYCSRLANKLVDNKKIEVFIGAADENTFFTLLRKKAKPKYYWNIEDGLGNYREFSWKSKLIIFFKRILFFFYGNTLHLASQKGVVRADKRFRINDHLSTSDNNLELGKLLVPYVISHENRYKSLIKNPSRFTLKEIIIVTHKCTGIKDKETLDNAIIKPHPKYQIEAHNDQYLLEKIPVEVVSILFPTVNFIIYDSYFCSSILNIIMLRPKVMMCLNFDVHKKYENNQSIRNLYDKIIDLYGNRFVNYKNIIEHLIN